jgi:hypothetical protein
MGQLGWNVGGPHHQANRKHKASPFKGVVPASELCHFVHRRPFDLVKLLPQLNVGQDQDLNRFAAEIEKRLCNYNPRELKQNEILRVATAHDATALLYDMDAILREREGAYVVSDAGAMADSIVSHMSA